MKSKGELIDALNDLGGYEDCPVAMRVGREEVYHIVGSVEVKELTTEPEGFDTEPVIVLNAVQYYPKKSGD